MSTVREVLGSDSVNQSENVFACADRVSPGDDPRDITIIRNEYLPLDLVKQSTYLRTSPFGAVIYNNKVSAGSVIPSYDGKRFVLEVGCSTVIYLLINASSPMHHRVFIQSENGFSADTTIRKDAAEIAHNTRHIETIAKFEMYFILGALSSMGFAAWLSVTGSDATYLYAKNRTKAVAATNLTVKLFKELASIEGFAPTLHQKIIELIAAEVEGNWGRLGRQLPKTIITDKTTQAQVAGTLFAQWASQSANSFTIWSVMATLLKQAAGKSVTKTPDAYLTLLNQKYQPIVAKMQAVDISRPATIKEAASSFLVIFEESNIEVNLSEAETIIREVTSNPAASFKSLTNIRDAINEFTKAMNR